MSGTPTAADSIRGMGRPVKTAGSLRPFAPGVGQMKGDTRQTSQVYGSRIFTSGGTKREPTHSGRVRNFAITNANTYQG